MLDMCLGFVYVLQRALPNKTQYKSYTIYLYSRTQFECSMQDDDYIELHNLQYILIKRHHWES